MSEQHSTMNIMHLLYLRLHVSAELQSHYQVVVQIHKKFILGRSLFLKQAYISFYEFGRLADDGRVIRPETCCKYNDIHVIHKRMARFQKQGLKHGRLRNTSHSVIFVTSNSLLDAATDLRGIRRNASRTFTMLSQDTRGQPGLLPLHKHPVSTNCRYHLVMLFLHDASFLNRARNSRCTVITDLDTSKRSTQKAFHCCDAFLETGPRGPAVSMRSELLVAHEKTGQLPLLSVYVVPV